MNTPTWKPDPCALVRNALAAAPLFARTPREQLDRLAACASLRRYRRGDPIPKSTDGGRQALLAVSGVLESSQIIPSGRRFVMGIFGPGELMGLVRLFDEPMLPYGFVAREPALVAHLPCRELVAIFDADPLRWKEVARFALDRQVDTLDTLLNQAVLGRTDCRIAATLQRLGNLFGVQGARETRLRLRLSQDDLADMLAVSRQTVNKELRRLEAAGILRCTYNTLVILDRGALSRMAAERHH